MSASKAAILSVGAELVLGQIADTNAAWLAARLAECGWTVGEIRVVGDELGRIVSAVRELSAAHGVLLVTGGLGPTDDDLTRQALAAAGEVGLRESAELVEEIKARFAAFNRPMADRNRVQALLPEGAEGICNPAGTAPAIRLRIGGCECFAMPGVPREMKRIAADSVLPAIGRGPAGVVRQREFHLWGMGESTVAERLGGLMARNRRPEVGTRVNDSIVTVRILAQGTDEAELGRLLASDKNEVRARLGGAVFGMDSDTLPGVVVRLLSERGETLATAESCTGGLVAKLLTDIPGVSAVLTEGFVTYSNSAKTLRLGVPEDMLERHGAVSEAVARAMAEGVRRAARTDYGIGITGIAGPGGGTEEKPVGLVHIAVDSAATTVHAEHRMIFDREGNRRRAAHAALGMLWRMLAEGEDSD